VYQEASRLCDPLLFTAFRVTGGNLAGVFHAADQGGFRMSIIAFIDFCATASGSLVIIISAWCCWWWGLAAADKRLPIPHRTAVRVLGLFGFLSCVAVIFLYKWFGHLGIMKPEDYYDNGDIWFHPSLILLLACSASPVAAGGAWNVLLLCRADRAFFW
jgi:hypothetical protein